MEVPPDSGPPPQFAAYPRPQFYGDPSKLQALSDGYFGLNTVFLYNFGLAILLNVVGRIPNFEFGLILFLISIPLIGLVVGYLSYPKNKLIGYGCNWSKHGPLTASILMGLNSALCCGIIGYVVVQNIALKEMRKYGVRGGAFGLRKRDVQAVVDALNSEQHPHLVMPSQAP